MKVINPESIHRQYIYELDEVKSISSEVAAKYGLTARVEIDDYAAYIRFIDVYNEVGYVRLGKRGSHNRYGCTWVPLENKINYELKNNL